MTWAISQKTGSPSAKTVLWSIANYANERWVCWPGQTLIVQESEQSHDSVQRRLTDLEALGLIRRIPLKVSGRKTVDFYILQPSPLFVAEIAEIEFYLPRGFAIDPKWLGLHVHAECGSDDIATATLPQTLPQPAENVTATVRQQEPSTEPREPRLRESARAHEASDQPEAPKPSLDFAAVDRALIALAKVWPPGAIGDSAKARAALAVLDDGDLDAAVERAPYYLRALQVAKRSYVPSIATYAKNREFVHHQPPKGTAPLTLDPRGRVDAISRSWWFCFAASSQVASTPASVDWINRQVSGALSFGMTWPVEPAKRAEIDAAAERELRPFPKDGDHADTWRAHYRSRGINMPTPDKAEVVWLPATGPPE